MFSDFINIQFHGEVVLPKKFDDIFFKVPPDNRLHLGDSFFLKKICDRLNLNTTNNPSTIVYLTTIRRLDFKMDGIFVGFDWAKRIIFSPEEHLRLEFKRLGCHSDIFLLGDKSKRVLFSSEIASNKLRIFGLKRKFIDILKVFSEEGFAIYHVGMNYPDWIEKYNLNVKENIASLKDGELAIRSSNYFALISFDNYWMHVAGYYDLRRYVLQRRKFTIRNLINHISSLNFITNENCKTFYIN
jgi:hypothetical protein